MKKSYFISGSLCAMFLLYGCTEAELNGSEELSEEYVESAFDKLNDETATKLPMNVENGTVSEDVYKETLRYLTDFTDYEDKMMSYQNRLNNDPTLYNNETFKTQYREYMDAYEVFIKGFHLSSSTEIDFEIEANLSDVLFYTSNMISAIRQYIDTGETYHVISLEETVNMRNTSYTALTNSFKEHKLYTE